MQKADKLNEKDPSEIIEEIESLMYELKPDEERKVKINMMFRILECKILKLQYDLSRCRGENDKIDYFEDK